MPKELATALNYIYGVSTQAEIKKMTSQQTGNATGTY